MELYYQEKIENWLKTLWLIFAIVTIIGAYQLEDQTIAWKACFAFAIIVTIAVVPDWPLYKRHAVVFHGIEVATEQPNSSKKKKST